MSSKKETILIQGVYPYEIPAPPKDKTKIINHEIKDKAEQYWRTPKMPNFKNMTAYEIEKFIETEEHRIENGCHFYNNGEIVYINGAHYEYMTYWKPDYEISFRHTDRLYFYFDEFVDNYHATYGKVIFKPRVGGFTAKENFLSYRKAKSGFGKHVALINTTDDNAKMIQYKPILSCHLQYPEFLKPNIRMVNGKLPESGMYFSPSTDTDKKKYLNGWIVPFPPLANSLDGKRLHYIFLDEYAKMESKDPEAIIKPYLKTIYLPATDEIQGRMTFVSTLGTDDKLMKKAIEFSLKMWRDSDFNEIDKNGFTKSKFLRYFISCYDVANIDKYGFPDIEKNKEKQEHVLKQIIKEEGEFSKAHITELRENPRTIEDLLNSPKTGSSFNVGQKISIRKDALLHIPKEERGYVGGKFIMTHTGVVFDTSQKDYGWKIRGYILKTYNLCTKKNGYWTLPKFPEGVVGYDPVKFKKPTSKHFSQPSILIYKHLDHYAGNKIKRQIIGQFYGRKEDNDEVNEQAVLASIYFGFYLAPERNVGIDYYERNGYEKLIPISPYDNGRGIMMTTGRGEKNVLEHGISAIYKWVIGYQDDKTPNVDTIIFEEFLEQLESFTPDELNTHDIIAAALQCFLISKIFIEEKEIIKENKTNILGAMYHKF